MMIKNSFRPMDKDRDGFVGRSRSINSRRIQCTVARGATIYCEIGGGGMSADAYHITAPHPDGRLKM
jgi:3-oxoacyl-[acyl-carrier-protein] synthase II